MFLKRKQWFFGFWVPLYETIVLRDTENTTFGNSDFVQSKKMLHTQHFPLWESHIKEIDQSNVYKLANVFVSNKWNTVLKSFPEQKKKKMMQYIFKYTLKKWSLNKVFQTAETLTAFRYDAETWFL